MGRRMQGQLPCTVLVELAALVGTPTCSTAGACANKTRHLLQSIWCVACVGEALEGGPVQLSHGADATRFFAGALDLKCLAAMGWVGLMEGPGVG